MPYAGRLLYYPTRQNFRELCIEARLNGCVLQVNCNTGQIAIAPRLLVGFSTLDKPFEARERQPL